MVSNTELEADDWRRSSLDGKVFGKVFGKATKEDLIPGLGAHLRAQQRQERHQLPLRHPARPRLLRSGDV